MEMPMSAISSPEVFDRRATWQDRLRQIAVLTGAVLDLLMSLWLGNSLDQAAGSDPTPVYFLPAGYAFAVWGLIYLGGLALAIYQLWPGQATRAVHRATGGWVAVCTWLTALWMLFAGLAGNEGAPDFRPELVALTVVVLFGMLLALTLVLVQLRALDATLTTADRWLLQVPTTVFFAWLNVAAIANMTAALDAYRVSGGSLGWLWATGFVLVAMVLALLIVNYLLSRVAIVAYACVIVWAFVALCVNNIGASSAVAWSALIAATVVALAAMIRFRALRPPGARLASTPAAPVAF